MRYQKAFFQYVPRISAGKKDGKHELGIRQEPLADYAE
jgi:hypothetical protein